ncbi:MAG: hypothetical protein EOP48_12155 [Sphingobacteriales bacterium]|nr:MAG: hypothetical protein EOP48_12155 [Sphingobacteriales bacterium]
MKSNNKKSYHLAGTDGFGSEKNVNGAKGKGCKISPTSLFILSGRKNNKPVLQRGEIRVLKIIVPKNGLRGLL